MLPQLAGVFVPHSTQLYPIQYCYHEGSALHCNGQVQTERRHGYTRVVTWLAMHDLCNGVGKKGISQPLEMLVYIG